MLPLIIEWIYYALASNDIKLALINVLRTYYKNQSLKAIFESENVSEKKYTNLILLQIQIYLKN
ncbi:hypothetical protein [Spiroplasma ixodetis]|uniref:hypothetical protein n=1 Tax=Spiroplasma ixodetis TaxID=2141 RepID=UPI002578F95A|nr:hypothetical protein [Spiroplasma ixodetis]WJG70733.1 hypothetical protein SIXOD_v1c19520 [Spiroplasma ixodetis Y32]